MLAFFDESGIPHPHDSCANPVVVSVCIEREVSRFIAGHLYALKRRLGTPEDELKGSGYITRRVFTKRHNEWEVVEAFFDLCRTLPFTLFAVIMERPAQVPFSEEADGHIFLPNQYRYLLQRISQHAEENGRMATLLFDGDGSNLHGSNLAKKFEAFLYRSTEGRSFTAICDAPFYVDSKLTQGIQIADMAAAVLRHYQENKLNQGLPTGDGFLSAINRYYGVLRGKTVNMVTPEGFPRSGIYLMPERDHYRRDVEQGKLPGT